MTRLGPMVVVVCLFAGDASAQSDPFGVQRRANAAERMIVLGVQLAATESANTSTSFAGLSPTEAVTKARDVALANPAVLAALANTGPPLPKPRSEEQGCELRSGAGFPGWIVLGALALPLARVSRCRRSR